MNKNTLLPVGNSLSGVWRHLFGNIIMNIYKWDKCNKEELSCTLRGYNWGLDLIRSLDD